MFAWAEPLNGAMDFLLITIVLIFDVVVQKFMCAKYFCRPQIDGKFIGLSGIRFDVRMTVVKAVMMARIVQI